MNVALFEAFIRISRHTEQEIIVRFHRLLFVCMTLLLPNLGWSQDTTFEVVTVGIGYQILGDGSYIGDELPLWETGAGDTPRVDGISACQRPGSIDGLAFDDSIIEAASMEELMLLLSTISFWARADTVLVCDGTEVQVQLLPEVISGGQRYYYNGSDRRTLNQLISIWARMRLRNDEQMTFEALETGGISISLSGRIILGLGFTDTGLAAVVNVQEAGDLVQIELLVERMGLSSSRTDIDLSDGRRWLKVEFGHPSSAEVLSAIEQAFTTGANLNVAALDISIGRGLEEIYREYGLD